MNGLWSGPRTGILRCLLLSTPTVSQSYTTWEGSSLRALVTLHLVKISTSEGDQEPTIESKPLSGRGV